MSQDQREDLRKTAAAHADRLVGELEADLKDLRAASPRAIDDATRSAGEQLAADAIAAAQNLAARLRATTRDSSSSTGNASS
jgi:hypothetical protein